MHKRSISRSVKKFVTENCNVQCAVIGRCDAARESWSSIVTMFQCHIVPLFCVQYPCFLSQLWDTGNSSVRVSRWAGQ